MPPPESGKKLSADQVVTLRQWIAKGAKWDKHWAFESPRKHAIDEAMADHPWIRQPFDAFVLERLKAASLSPSPAADRATLIRRLSFDLTGLPPTQDELTEFLNDDTERAFEHVVAGGVSVSH